MIRHYFVVSAVVVSLAALAAAQEKPDPLTGRWLGKVTANVGEMPIEVEVTVADGKVTGAVKNFHGAFKITQGERQKDGRWKLTFAADDGGTGTLLGAVDADAFTGEWDFRPNAVGTFALTRAK